LKVGTLKKASSRNYSATTERMGMEVEDSAGFAYRLDADGALTAWDVRGGGGGGGAPVLVGEASVWAVLDDYDDDDEENEDDIINATEGTTSIAPRRRRVIRTRGRRPPCERLALVADGTMLEVAARGGVVVTLDTRDVLLPRRGSSNNSQQSRVAFDFPLFKSQRRQEQQQQQQGETEQVDDDASTVVLPLPLPSVTTTTVSSKVAGDLAAAVAVVGVDERKLSGWGSGRVSSLSLSSGEEEQMPPPPPLAPGRMVGLLAGLRWALESEASTAAAAGVALDSIAAAAAAAAAAAEEDASGHGHTRGRGSHATRRTGAGPEQASSWEAVTEAAVREVGGCTS
jgi:hypothetical protein